MPAVEDNTPDLQEDFALLDSEEPITSEEETTEEIPPKPKVVAPKSEPKEETEAKTSEVEAEEEPPRELLPHERPTLEQIRKEFPEFFKKFPTLKDAFFREKQFSEIFHTPQEAQSAATDAETFIALRDDMVNGTGEAIIPALKESDSLSKFSKNFLPNLYKADKDLHWQTILPIIEDMVRYAYSSGNKAKDDNLKWGAYYVSQFLLGDPEVAEGKRTLVPKDEPAPKSNKLDEERQAYENQKYNDFNIGVHEEIYKSLVSDINKGFKEEDGLTKFMREAIRDKILAEVVRTVKADKVHSKYLDRLWLEAKKEGYRDKSRIINASLARAKDLVPKLRRQLIAEALGSSPLESVRRQEVVDRQTSRREPGSQGREGANRVRTPSAKNINWKKTSDLDFLNDNYTRK